MKNNIFSKEKLFKERQQMDTRFANGVIQGVAKKMNLQIFMYATSQIGASQFVCTSPPNTVGLSAC